MGDPELSPEELEAQHVAELPDREAMSLMSTGALGDFGGLGGGFGLPSTDETTGPTSTGTADDLSGTTGDPTSTAGTDGMASGTDSDSGSISDADRSETVTQSDSASATS